MLTAYSGKTFSNIYASFLPLFTNRPLAPLPLAVTSLLFGGEPAFYIFINTILWLATAGILGIILYPFLGYYSYFFFFLAATPIIGSTVIFSPVMQLTATVSLFLWAVATYLLFKYSNIKYRVAAYMLICAAMLIYEVFFPLLILTVFFSLKENYTIKNICYKTLPIIIILFCIFLYQKAIIPKFFVSHSRFNPPEKVAYFIHDSIQWILFIFVDSAELVLNGLFRIFRLDAESLLYVAVATLIQLLLLLIIIKKNHQANAGKLIFAAVFCFLSCSLLYTLAGDRINMVGYSNRRLSTTWLSISILISILLLYVKSKKHMLVCALAVSFLVSSNFIIQRNEQIKATNFQSQIINDFIAKIDELPEGSAPFFVLALIPDKLPTSFNGEVIFNRPWDFAGAVRIRRPAMILGAVPVTYEKIQNACTMEDDAVVYEGWCRMPIASTMLYIYKKDGTSTLRPLDRNALAQHIGKVF
ncbi:MAG: hypothetical protein E7022_02490 [Desulfovibrio desulfuricans]|nr:hypothetical protein [Desulfovibrio desulfuricans]